MRIYLSYGIKQDEESAYINTGIGAFIEVILESCTSGLVAGSCCTKEHLLGEPS